MRCRVSTDTAWPPAGAGAGRPPAHSVARNSVPFPDMTDLDVGPHLDVDSDESSRALARIGGRTRTAGGALPAKVRVSALAALVAVAVYCLCCLVYNAPDSRRRTVSRAPVMAFMEPYFWQDWRLETTPAATTTSCTCAPG